MKIALLGNDCVAFSLAETAVREFHCQLTLIVDREPQNWTQPLASGVPCHADWELLLHASDVNAVIVGSILGMTQAERELRHEQLRKLTQISMPLLLVQPACDAIVGYELEMNRQDEKSPLHCYFPGQHHPFLQRLTSWIQQNVTSPIGKVEQISIERHQIGGNRAEILNRLSCDVSCIRALLGRMKSISAMANAPELQNFMVNLSGDMGILARWTHFQSSHSQTVLLLVSGTRGRTTLRMPLEYRSLWEFEVSGDISESLRAPACQGMSEAISAFLKTIHTGIKDTEWIEFSRDKETAELASISLARGKTVEIYEEDYTEQNAFKGVMAMGGCGLLLFTMMSLLMVALVEGLRLPLRDLAIWHLWPLMIAGPLILFLLLQALSLVTRKEAT